MTDGIKDYLAVLNRLAGFEEDVFPKAYREYVLQHKGWWRTYDARAAHPSQVDDWHLLNAARAFLKRYIDVTEDVSVELNDMYHSRDYLAGMLPEDEKLLRDNCMPFDRYLAFAAYSQSVWVLMAYEIRKRKLAIPNSHAVINAFIVPPRIEWYRDVLRWLQDEIARAEAKKSPTLTVNVKRTKRSNDND